MSLALQGLAFMAFDIVEEQSGSFCVWGRTTTDKSVLVRVDDFEPYFYVRSPTKKVSILLNALISGEQFCQ